MKKIIFLIAALFYTFASHAQPDTAVMQQDAAPMPASVQQLWGQANAAYVAGSYNEAIEAYNAILDSGTSSFKLYYNLGNAHFKAGHTGKSILYYNKAQRLAPTDKDLRHNLAVASTYVKDQIEQVPEFFVERWIRNLSRSLSGSGWTMMSLGALAAACAAAVIYLLSRTLGRRKAGFMIMLAFAGLFIISTIMAISARRQAANPTEGVVMSTALSVKSSPDRASKDLFVIHEGTKVEVVGELGEWKEVVIADGKKGWIEESAIEMI